jgi:hypothetical protein
LIMNLRNVALQYIQQQILYEWHYMSGDMNGHVRVWRCEWGGTMYQCSGA